MAALAGVLGYTSRMPVDPALLALLAQAFPPGAPKVWKLPPAEARPLMDGFIELGGPMAPLASVHDTELSRVPVRVYRADGDGPQPALIYLHGGGWELGAIKHYDAVCSRIAHYSGWTVISVEYRLAPENKFPIPLLDCWTAVQAARANAKTLDIDASRIAVGGDSAGGNLSAGVTLLARDYGVPLAGQVLIYPVTDSVSDRESYQYDYLLNRAAMEAFWGYYLNHVSESGLPLAAPLRAESWAGLPPALVLTAEYDPLRDEGEEYARCLEAAGVRVTVARYAGMIHGFVSMGAVVPQGIEATKQIAEFLRALHCAGAKSAEASAS
jgi:acetyl esterase